MPDSPQADGVELEGFPPLFAEDTSIDDKGRLKFPKSFQRYWGITERSTYYCGTYNLRTAILYKNADLYEFKQQIELQLGPVKAAPMIFNLEKFGGYSKVDGEGRLTLPGGLKELLDLNSKQKVYLRFRKKRIEIVREADYEMEFQRQKLNLGESLALFEAAGL